MRRIAAADCRLMPWKNGRGSTTEIAVHPSGAALDAFEWRVSMARVAEDGPFSVFPGVDRTLALVEGAGIVLAIAGRGEATLTRDSPPLLFPADVPTAARLIGGPVMDLNVMTRRGRWRQTVERLDVAGTASFIPRAGFALAIVLGGTARFRSGDAELTLAPGDALVLEPPAREPVQVYADKARLFLVRLDGRGRGG